MASLGVPSNGFRGTPDFLLRMEGNRRGGLESSTIQTRGDPCHNASRRGHDPVFLLGEGKSAIYT